MWQALLLCCGQLGSVPDVRTHFHQVHPSPVGKGHIMASELDFRPTAGQPRAVVLIHGCNYQFTAFKAERPKPGEWDVPGSVLVKTLGADADVYAFRYGQTTPVDDIPHLPTLREGLKRLKQLGYKQLILFGHSAGAVVARQFVEDYPDAGVTRVVQVCPPNGGCKWVDLAKYLKLSTLANPAQAPFVHSLTVEERGKKTVARRAKKVPATVDFLCVVGGRDWVVAAANQWTSDLRDQGIPSAVLPSLGHELARCGEEHCKQLCGLLLKQHGRWSARDVLTAAASLPAGPVVSPGEDERPVPLSAEELHWLRPHGTKGRPAGGK
jgi:pimeloyl-ACP methyl ester carboxylesterase